MGGFFGDGPPRAGGGTQGPYLRLLLTVMAIVSLAAGLVLGLSTVLPDLGGRDPARDRIAEGVRAGHGDIWVDLGGLDRYQATGVLEDVAADLTVLPRNAYLDRSTGGVVPAVEGRRLDVAATVARSLQAAPGEAVPFVFFPVPPTVTLADFPQAPVFHADPAKKAVAIILNIAWGDEHLDLICRLVEEAGGRLTICPVGSWLEGSEARAAWLKEAAARGHEIGNHGYYNRPMTYTDPQQVRDEIRAAADLIEKACGRRPVIFAPPMGERSGTMLKAAAEEGCRTVIWSLDTVDWRLEGVEVIARRVVSRVRAGDIILCHPTPQTGPAMERFLPVLAEKGLRIVTVSELLSPALPEEEEGPAG